MLWRHIEWRDGAGEVRRSRRLVISSFSAIGNYDYGFFWYLYQDGTIALRGQAHRACSRPAAVAPGERPGHGMLVAPGLNAMVHQHFFNMRLDLDVDGLDNSRRRGLDASRSRRGPRTRTATRSARAGGRFATRGRGPAPRRPGVGALVGDRQPEASATASAQPIGYRLLPGETTFAVRAARRAA